MDSWFFHDDEIFLKDFKVSLSHKRRLVKIVDKKTKEFKAWTVTETVNINTQKTKQEDIEKFENYLILKNQIDCLIDDLHHLSESGIFDYTSEGSFFGLTDQEKERALEKRTNLYA